MGDEGFNLKNCGGVDMGLRGFGQVNKRGVWRGTDCGRWRERRL